MSFHPEHLPTTVYEIYKNGPVAWILVVQVAVQQKITDIDHLANIAFYLHHPELSGRPLSKDETKLIAEWLGFRTKIKPLIPHWIKIYGLSEPTNDFIASSSSKATPKTGEYNARLTWRAGAGNPKKWHTLGD